MEYLCPVGVFQNSGDNMKICKIESVKVTGSAVSIYVRIKIDPRTRRAYNRFRQYLYDNLVAIKSVGYGGRSGLRFENCHVNMVKTSKYMHLIIFVRKKERPTIIDALSHFDIIKTT